MKDKTQKRYVPIKIMKDKTKKSYVSKDINKIISFLEKQSVYNLLAIFFYDYKKEEMFRIGRDGVVNYFPSLRVVNQSGIKQNKYHITLSYYDVVDLNRSKQNRRLKNEETKIITPTPTPTPEIITPTPADIPPCIIRIIYTPDRDDDDPDLDDDDPYPNLEEEEALATDRRISKKQLLSKLKKLLKANVSSFTKTRDVVITKTLVKKTNIHIHKGKFILR